jgi:hypothetical protein
VIAGQDRVLTGKGDLSPGVGGSSGIGEMVCGIAATSPGGAIVWKPSSRSRFHGIVRSEYGLAFDETGWDARNGSAGGEGLAGYDMDCKSLHAEQVTPNLMDRWSKLTVVVALILGVILIAVDVSQARPQLSGTFKVAPHAEAVPPRVLARDFHDRLARSGSAPAAVTCWQYLLAKPGATAHCEARFKTWFKGPELPPVRTRSGWLADRAEYTVTRVTGRSVEFAITPGLSGAVLPLALQWDELVDDALVDCHGGGGIEGVAGTAETCTAQYVEPRHPCFGEKCLLRVGVDRVYGLSLDLKILEAGTQPLPAPPVSLPSGAWFQTDALPLQDSQHWPDLATVAEPFDGQLFTLHVLGDLSIREMCHVFPPTGDFAGAVGARAYVYRYPPAWSLKQQILHYPGDPWTAGRKASATFHSLSGALSRCAAGLPDAQVRISIPESPCVGVGAGCRQIAGSIEAPGWGKVAHFYLSSVGSAVSELSFHSSLNARPPWPAVDDAMILATMNRSLCAVWMC